MSEKQNQSQPSGFHELKTAGGSAFIRVEEVQAVLPTGLNQCTVVLRGGAAAGMNFGARDVAALMGITEPAAPTLKLAE